MSINMNKMRRHYYGFLALLLVATTNTSIAETGPSESSWKQSAPYVSQGITKLSYDHFCK